MNKLRFLLVSCLLLLGSVYGEPLSFKAGDKASYKLQQQLNGELSICGDLSTTDSDESLLFDLCVLSDNDGYPYEVEIIVKDSSSLELKPIFLQPMIFKVEAPFQVKETTDVLSQVEDASDFGVLGATPWTYELFLTQLFQLSGEDLSEGNAYSVNCYQFLNWEDDPLDEKEIELNESSEYTVNEISSDMMKATWSGEAEVSSEKMWGLSNLKGKVLVCGTTEWNRENPLVQQRNLIANIKEERSGLFPTKCKLNVKQTLESTP